VPRALGGGLAPLTTRVNLLALVIASAALDARAEGIDLTVHELVPPLPRTLQMRTAEDTGAATTAPPSTTTARQPTASPAVPDVETMDRRLRQQLDSTALAPSLTEQVVFRVNVGYGLDGGAPSSSPLANGHALEENGSYEALRSYGFGDVVVGTNGLGAASLSSYLAAQFRIDQDSAQAFAVPTVYDGAGVRNVLVRSGYAEVSGRFLSPNLTRLRLRAGRQFHYGPAIAHFDGATIAYETEHFDASVFLGQRVSNFGFDLDQAIEDDAGIVGATGRVSLQRLIRAPLVVSGELLRFDGNNHVDSKLAYRFDARNSVLAQVRYFDGKVGRQALLLRSRLSRVTTIAAELTNRTRNDFVYDLLLSRPLGGDSTDTRRYLSFGEVRPRTLFNLRAGTVLLRNIDLLLRGGFAVDRHDESAQTASTFFASYGELGGALEVRLRRSLKIGSSLLGRRYRRDQQQLDVLLRDGIPAPLLSDTGSVGERNFVEGGVNLRYSAGARKFTAAAEIYGRMYWVRTPYIEGFERDSDNRSGGRFSVEGWAGSTLRIRAEYDVARLPEVLAPELRRAQSLRLLTEGHF